MVLFTNSLYKSVENKLGEVPDAQVLEQGVRVSSISLRNTGLQKDQLIAILQILGGIFHSKGSVIIRKFQCKEIGYFRKHERFKEREGGIL